MSATDSMPLVFFRVLADRAGAPAALLLLTGQGDSALLADLAGTEEFTALPSHMACLYAPGLAPSLMASLSAARWQALDPATVFTSDERFSASDVPAGAKWIDGGWILQPPAKVQG